jgi:hypothetical protein
VLVVCSYFPVSGIASCRQQLASNGLVVTVCGPVGTDDLVVVGLSLLLAGMFIWPDLSELGIPGLVTIKRRLAEQEQATRAVEADVQNLALAQPTPGVTAVTATDEAPLSPTSSVSVLPTEPIAFATERGRNEQELLVLARDLDGYVRLANRFGPRLQQRSARPEELEALGRWLNDFDGQLRRWAAIRNTAVHVPERLTDADVANGVELGRSLVSEAERYLASTGGRHGIG